MLKTIKILIILSLICSHNTIAPNIIDKSLLVEQFLENIKQIESNNGKNINHIIINNGKYKGQQAIGSYGLLPTTIDELVKTYFRTFFCLNQIQDNNYKNIILSNPKIEYLLAKKLAIMILNKNNYDLVRSAYAWNVGHNKNLSNISNDIILKNRNAKCMKSLLTPSFLGLK